MRRDSLAFGISGACFGLLLGWIIGSQQGRPAPAPPPATAQAPANAAPAPKPFDDARAAELERQANAEPANAAVRVELGNVYFDGERYDRAITSYEAALKINPKDVNASTDLAVAYYYSNQVERALAQLDRSLALDPKHLKSLLNQGIIRAWGKQDLNGAAESWQRVVALAPGSEEGRRAQQGLEGIEAAHAARGTGGSTAARP